VSARSGLGRLWRLPRATFEQCYSDEPFLTKVLRWPFSPIQPATTSAAWKGLAPGCAGPGGSTTVPSRGPGFSGVTDQFLRSRATPTAAGDSIGCSRRCAIPLVLESPKTAATPPKATPEGASYGRALPVSIGLVNNMPDPAFVETERQFLQLLRAAAKSVALRVRLFSLPGIARGREIETRINTAYFAMEDLYRQPPTALIVTGTEPILRDLTREPYFAELAKLLEWSAGSTCSVILSCLAAHAAALVFDGIARVRLPTKCAGVFDHSLPQPTHRLLGGLAGELRTPHSRINGIPVRRLTESKYLVLATSTAAGWNLAVKEHGESLFLLFQGHPEYSTSSLLREYRRDARRYLLRQSESYPALPVNYLSAPSERLLRNYERAARSARGTGLGVGEFPFSAVETSLRNSWRSDSTVLYQNWIEMVVERAAGQSGLGQATQLAGAYRESRR